MFKKYIEMIDVVSIEPKLFIKRKPKISSISGVFGSIIALMLILALSLYFMIQVIARTNVYILFKTDSSYMVVNNMTNYPFMVMFTDFVGRPFKDDEKIYNFELWNMNYFNEKLPDGSLSFTNNLISIKLQKCSFSKMGNMKNCLKKYLIKSISTVFILMSIT